jgi:hypothetical protein
MRGFRVDRLGACHRLIWLVGWCVACRVSLSGGAQVIGSCVACLSWWSCWVRVTVPLFPNRASAVYVNGVGDVGVAS